MNINGYDLVRTCWACPEQYDVMKDGRQVGYLRLRHGHFYADVPDCGGDTVYEANPEGDGIFAEDERERYLTEAVAAINAHYNPDDGVNALAAELDKSPAEIRRALANLKERGLIARA